MAINVFEINGKNPKVDYNQLKKSFENNFSRTCNDASIYVLNSFPVLVSSDTDIDLILIVAIEDKNGNYISLKKNDRNIYLHNLIMPIKLISIYKTSKIEIEGESIIVDDCELDFSKELTSLTFNLKYYINDRCGINEEVYIHPFVFIENNDHFVSGDILVSSSLDFSIISDWWKESKTEIFISKKQWKENYEFVSNDIEKIINQASKDSVLGYLTKKKIDKIGSELSKQTSIVSYLGNELIEIKGKAGSGKTTEMLTLCINGLKAGYNPFFLTYNKLLVYDISQVLKGIINRKEIHSYASVTTLHRFFFDLSKTLAVLHIMTAERQKEILQNLKVRIRLSFNLIKEHITFDKRPNFELIKSEIQNSSLDKGTIEVGIDLANFLSKRIIKSLAALNNYSLDFFKQQENKLTKLETDKIFIADYYGVLKNIHTTIQNPEKFYIENNVSDKKEIIDLATGVADKYVNDEGKIDLKKFKEFNNRRIGGRRGKKRLVFIDEAQDCHNLEKEILATIYGKENIVIANGGKEQLIRHVDLCNWGVISGQKIKSIVKNKRNKSYRIKPEIAKFCNYFGQQFGIDLQLESLETMDKGEIIFDLRKSITQNEIKDLFGELHEKGRVNGCLEYESILILLESLNGTGSNNVPDEENIIINEYGNISSTRESARGKWNMLKVLEQDGYQFFDGTVNDKSKLKLPYPNEIRVIFYESCRGLEAWSTACFDLDKFFEAKRKEDDAEKFLIDNEKGLNIQNMFISNEERRKMYAATWTLLPMTRAIDTLYISINDVSSELGKIVDKYIQLNPENVKILR